jgi:hypothetical protein
MNHYCPYCNATCCTALEKICQIATVKVTRPYTDKDGRTYGETVMINGEEWFIHWNGNIYRGHFENNLDKPDRFFGFVDVKDGNEIKEAGYELILDYLQHPNDYMEKNYNKLKSWLFYYVFESESNQDLHSKFSYAFWCMISNNKLDPKEWGKTLTETVNRIKSKVGSKEDMIYWLSQVKAK